MMDVYIMGIHIGITFYYFSMKLAKYSQLKHGMKVLCEIDGKEIKDAKISIDEDGRVYVCQNVKDGFDAEDKLGYKYSWILSYEGEDIEDWDDNVKNLRTAEKTLDDFSTLEIGDVLVDRDGDERTILDVREKIIGLSNLSHGERYGNFYTKDDLDYYGCKLKEQPEEDETVELTMDEIAEKFGIDVKKLKVKKQ